jgi:hypothetical protein
MMDDREMRDRIDSRLQRLVRRPLVRRAALLTAAAATAGMLGGASTDAGPEDSGGQDAAYTCDEGDPSCEVVPIYSVEMPGCGGG